MVQLVGNVVENAIKDEVNNNKHVINFTIALNYKYRNATGVLVNLPTFVECKWWKDSDVYQYITKGRPIAVFGRIYSYGYTNNKGEAVGVIRCNVNSVELLSGGSNQSDQTDKQTPSNEDEVEPVAVTAPGDDLPF